MGGSPFGDHAFGLGSYHSPQLPLLMSPRSKSSLRGRQLSLQLLPAGGAGSSHLAMDQASCCSSLSLGMPRPLAFTPTSVSPPFTPFSPETKACSEAQPTSPGLKACLVLSVIPLPTLGWILFSRPLCWSEILPTELTLWT